MLHPPATKLSCCLLHDESTSHKPRPWFIFSYLYTTHSVPFISLFITLELPFSWWSLLWTNRLSSMQLWQQPIAKSYIITSSWGRDAMVPVEDAAPILLQQVKTGQRGSGDERGRDVETILKDRENLFLFSLCFSYSIVWILDCVYFCFSVISVLVDAKENFKRGRRGKKRLSPFKKSHFTTI